MSIKTRNEAHLAAERFFFTGHPCKNGHLAARYTSTGGCIECLSRYKVRVNPFSHDLVHYSEVFWRSKRLNDAQLKQLKEYVQGCIDHFTNQILPPVCSRCTGQGFLPFKSSMGVEFKGCPNCNPQGLEFAPGSPAPPLR